MQKHFASMMSNMKKEGTYKSERIITSSQKNLIDTSK